MSEYHPKTEVSFAPTKVFTAKYGMAEAEVQRKRFERPTWASIQPPDLPGCAAEHPPVEKKEVPEPQFLFMAFALGLFCGMAITWIAIKK